MMMVVCGKLGDLKKCAKYIYFLIFVVVVCVLEKYTETTVKVIFVEVQ
jgi:hypothetical protein